MLEDMLTADDVIAVTGMRRPADQCRRLLEWRVPYRARSDGSPMLTWSAINAALADDLKPGRPAAAAASQGPRLILPAKDNSNGNAGPGSCRA